MQIAGCFFKKNILGNADIVKASKNLNQLVFRVLPQNPFTTPTLRVRSRSRLSRSTWNHFASGRSVILLRSIDRKKNQTSHQARYLELFVEKENIHQYQRPLKHLPSNVSAINPLLTPATSASLFYRFSSSTNGASSFRSNSKSRSIDFVMADNKYIVGYAKLGTSSCKKCKVKIEKGGLRIGKVTANPFSDDGGDMKQWFHPKCIFETFVRARATTKKIEDPNDAEGFYDLEQKDKDIIQKLIDDNQQQSSTKAGKQKTSKKTVQVKLVASPAKLSVAKTTPSKQNDDAGPSTSSATDHSVASNKDNSFRGFRLLCAEIAEESSYIEKTKLVHNFIYKGHKGDGFYGNLYLLMKLLLPGVVKTVYNLNNKQLVKLFSMIFGTNLQRMTDDLDEGDVAETVRIFFEESKGVMPQKKSTLSLEKVDEYLTNLSKETKEDDQQRVLSKITKHCTANDLKMIVRLIKHDLRINAGAKHILDGLDPNAYAAFQASRDLKDVVERVKDNRDGDDAGNAKMTKKLSVRATLLTPVLPMLAEACRSVGQAMKKCPNGFYAEIKYDGERVQVHKKGGEFRYYSRSLKPVMDHKVRHFKEFIPKAFPTGNDLILDAEVLLMDTKTGNPLPFGTLGVHKKAAFQDAKVCLFVFDCLLINDNNLMEKPIRERRKILEKNMTTVKHRVHLSEIKHITKPDDLQDLMARVFKEGLEGLVLKDVNCPYEPGKRHWLKVKKDYLNEGSMADSADLVVLGSYYGTGNKGGMMSIFLMGVLDPASNIWVTVSKCGSGLDDKTLERLNKEMDVVKISKDPAKVPKWLNVKKSLVPDFVVKNPKSAPVWEIIGAEFSKAEIHTADGISIRFPRVQKMRDDKTWREATDLPRLKLLYAESKEKADKDMMKALQTGGTAGSDDDDSDGDTEVNSDDDVDKPGPSGKENSVKKAVKRGASGEDSEILKKRKRPEDDQNHSNSKDTSKSLASSNGDLPNLFHNLRIVLPKALENFKKLKRYILAFDGDVLHEFDSSRATHIITDNSDAASSKDSKSKATKVDEDWLWTCIKKKRLVSTTPFLVKNEVFRPWETSSSIAHQPDEI